MYRANGRAIHSLENQQHILSGLQGAMTRFWLGPVSTPKWPDNMPDKI